MLKYLANAGTCGSGDNFESVGRDFPNESIMILMNERKEVNDPLSLELLSILNEIVRLLICVHGSGSQQ